MLVALEAAKYGTRNRASKYKTKEHSAESAKGWNTGTMEYAMEEYVYIQQGSLRNSI